MSTAAYTNQLQRALRLLHVMQACDLNKAERLTITNQIRARLVDAYNWL